ncbi:hypothetical protein Hanom_Chr04g00374081 [Helianthus anomalus]
MNRKLHKYGHKPRTMEVLFDLEDEDGEDAFALIASQLGSSIRIIKNLRVCFVLTVMIIQSLFQLYIKER